MNTIKKIGDNILARFLLLLTGVLISIIGFIAPERTVDALEGLPRGKF